MRIAALAVAVLALASCGPAAQPLTPEQSSMLRPADARLAGLYEGSCKACHTVADSQAPLTGDRTKWDLRWEQGEDVLVAHVIQGKGQMPAGGQCFTCTPADYRALARFMAGKDK